jgi:hypothetical protein
LSSGSPTRTRRPAGRRAAKASESGLRVAAVNTMASSPPSFWISTTTSCRAALIM